MKYFKNLKQYNKWMKNKDIFQHIKNSRIQYEIIGFNYINGKIVFEYNDHDLFGIVERNESDFI